MFSITAKATTSLSALNTKPYEKTIYEEALKYAINSAEPLDKQSFTVTVDGKKLGDLITGQGFSEKDTNICFVSWASADGRITTLIPTIGKDNWEAEVCNRTMAVGVLSGDNEPVSKLAVIYDVQTPNANPFESIIFTLDTEKGVLSLDLALTEEIGTQGSRTLGSLKSAYQKRQQTAPAAPANVVHQVQRITEKEKLVTDPACVEYLQMKDGEPGLTRVDVMEKHGGKCPGDIQIRHRLFSVYVDNKTHQMLSDKDDPEEGTFSLLPDAP
ncbi:hypothetical protein [Erwinia endophytica]|uniref:hypothetical protein n=1 Tax=Erwinia endophytica TaxID=1563158 RepID=UPI001F03EFA5|nr:hypothetical protein [Erwinia endophytica]